MAPLFEWTDEMSVGIEEFDLHHKGLIALINELNDSVVSGHEATIVGEVLAQLSNYTFYHFLAEEEALQEQGYLGYALHKEQHLIFVERLLAFMVDLHNGEACLGNNVLSFLKEWLSQHILGTDKLYGPFLREKGLH